MLHEFTPKTRAESSITQSDARRLVDGDEFDASDEPKKNAFQLFVAGLHRGGVVGVRPPRRAEAPEVEHRGAEQQREEARAHPRGVVLATAQERLEPAAPGAVRVATAGVVTRRRLRHGGGALAGGRSGSRTVLVIRRPCRSSGSRRRGEGCRRRRRAEEDAVEDHELRDPQRAPGGDVGGLDHRGAGGAVETRRAAQPAATLTASVEAASPVSESSQKGTTSACTERRPVRRQTQRRFSSNDGTVPTAGRDARWRRRPGWWWCSRAHRAR